jgi:hypothetical protein
MMECVLTGADVDALAELLPDNAVVNGKINYRELNYVISHHTPRDLGHFYPLETDHRFSQRRTVGALPSYASQTMSTHLTMSPHSKKSGGMTFNQQEFTKSIATPGGMYVSTPFQVSPNPHANPSRYDESPRSSFDTNIDSYNRIVLQIIKRIRNCIEDLSHDRGAPFNIRRHFESYDPKSTGLLTDRAFQGCLVDLGIAMTTSDFYALSHMYEVSEGKIDYETFCKHIDNPRELENPSSKLVHDTSVVRTSQGKPDSLHEILSKPRNVQRIKDMIIGGVNIRGTFLRRDPDRTGLVSVRASLFIH